MDGAGTRIAAGVRASVAFAAEGWRGAWAPLLLLAAGQALTFVAGHADIQMTLASRLQLAGWALSALVILPALGALYRSALGGKRAKEVQFGGLQFGQAERSIFATFAASAVCVFLILTAMALAAAVFCLPLKNAGVLHVPGLGPFALWFVCAIPVLLVLASLGYGALSRLSLAQPAAVAERYLHLGKAVHLSRRWPASLAVVLALVELLPAAFLFGLARGLEALEHGWTQAAGLSAWPMLDASVAGVVLALLTAFLLLPLGVGARTYFYGRALAETRAGERRKAASTPVLAPVATAAAPETEVEDEAEPDPEPIVIPVPTEEEALAALAARLEIAAAQMEAAAEARAEANGWSPPMGPVRGFVLTRALTAPVLLTHANDRVPDPRWWSTPEHSEEPPVA